MKNSTLRKFIYLIYCYVFFSNVVFLYPLYAIMFQDNGMSDAQVSLLLMSWSVSSMILQIPLGILADKYSRKFVVIGGQVCKALCFLVWIFAPNFWGYLIGFALWGVQWSSINVFEAYVYDELKAFRKKSLYTKICGNNHSIGVIGYIASSMGSFLLFLGYDIITYITVFCVLISIVIISLTKTRAKVKVEKQAKYLKTVKFGIKLLRKKPKIFFTMFILTLMIGLAYIDEYFGLVGLEMGLSKENVGIIFISVLITESLGSWVAHKFEGRTDRSLYLGIVALGLIFISIFYCYNYYGIIILSVFYFIYAILRILLMARFQHSIESRTRATVLSFLSVFEQISSIGSYAIMMLSATYGSYKYGFFMLGTILAIVAILYWAIDRKPKKEIIRPKDFPQLLPSENKVR